MADAPAGELRAGTQPETSLPNSGTCYDPVVALASQPMSAGQILAVLICIALNALDGFDVLAISFAAPTLARDWGIQPAALGLVLSMELIGMTVGSIWLGSAADTYGRRPTILACLALMAGGMTAAIFANDVYQLGALRLLTGLGLGGMLAATNAMVAETCNTRSKNMAVAFMAAGYPVGAALGGAALSSGLVSAYWRDIFLLGAISSALFLPLTFAALPESIVFLSRSARGRPERISQIMQRFGYDARMWTTAPEENPNNSHPLKALFGADLRLTTTLLCLVYLGHITTFYFIMKWGPKIVADLGYAPAAAGSVLVWANVGGTIGSLLFSILARQVSPKSLALGTMLCSSFAVVGFGLAAPEMRFLSFAAAFAGFFTMSTVVSLYAIFVEAFPSSSRASGVGFVLGIGRGGAALSPILAGLLFEMDFSRSAVASVMSIGSILGALALFTFVRSRR